MKKVVQNVSADYLNSTRKMTPDQICDFLEGYRLSILGKDSPSRAISLRVPENVLGAFKARSQIEGIKYQTQIVALMRAWLEKKA